MPRTLLCLGCGIFTPGGHYMCVPGFLKVVCGMKLKIFLVGPCGVRGCIYYMSVRGGM
jgi:hypothetical protein